MEMVIVAVVAAVVVVDIAMIEIEVVYYQLFVWQRPACLFLMENTLSTSHRINT